MSGETSDARKPAFGVGTLVSHPSLGRGRIVGYEGESYVIVFRGGESRRVPWQYGDLKIEAIGGDPELDRIKQAVREVLEDRGWVDAEIEMTGRWLGGRLHMIPGKDGAQSKEIPIEQFFAKLIGIREKLRVLEQKINNHPKLSDEDKLELEGYISRCYGSLTTFNVLLGAKESQFKGMGGRAGAPGDESSA
jgi:hypothetical protein